ncbi:hypothetical protein CAOG_08903 [Capsaspora owczarzaki ATCC 30864]|uniref:hypothetical protein n=1 Tax=Capsaspora owczarzaki (strain ATCC 30864) TaxID=595528 RepID=UPI00035224CF|nr:hypothetical protein CAOG_08903 [Capsaspora owczarzaki ATCC 30864]|eukprot:XP_011270565.1 hypothetical protein CAOG_08903 [Capsaspora owczarzaki ATCC 30864]
MQIFTKVDLRSAYHLLRVKEGDEYKTAFRCQLGLFEFLVAPFGHINSGACFQRFIASLLQGIIGVVFYLDDILIHSDTLENHVPLVRRVFTILRDNQHYVKLEKSVFHSDSVLFLGYIVSKDGVKMDPAKLSAVLNWPVPETVHAVQKFLGFANYYRRFIKNFSGVITPITKLLGKDVPFKWTPECDSAFAFLKHSFTSAPVLAYPDPSKPFILETDASDFALGAILSQLDDTGVAHPVAFHSRKFTGSELAWNIYDKELCPIVESFKVFRHYLLGAKVPVKVITDHKNIEFWSTARLLNPRQTRWAQVLADFFFLVYHRAGTLHTLPDALSRSSSTGVGDPKVKTPTTMFPEKLLIAVMSDDFLSRVRQALATDILALEIAEDPSRFPKFTTKDDLLYFKSAFYAAGHFGIRKTIELVQRDYYWPKMHDTIQHYVESCETCIRSKTSSHKPYGLLKPLPIAEHPWKSISMDFITQLPPSNSFDAICVVVDRLTKMAHFMPCTTRINALGTADLLIRRVFLYHGLPDDIVSDRGSVFVSHLWNHLFTSLNTKINLSTAYHPQSDGQTEAINRILEQYLRCFISAGQDNWSDLLHLAEFAYNSSAQSSTGVSPFHANFGFNPRFDFSPALTPSPDATSLLAHISDVQANVRDHLKSAVSAYTKHANKHRIPPPDFQVGDQVLLSTSNIRSLNKLHPKWIGPFPIASKVNDVAFTLSLPSDLKIHPTFHVSLLKQFRSSSGSSRPQPFPYSEIVDGEILYRVSDILDVERRGEDFFYLCRWEGFSPSDTTWEPLSQSSNLLVLVRDFHRKFPRKPKPAARLLHS